MAEVKVLEASIVDEKSISTLVSGDLEDISVALQGLCVHILGNFGDLQEGAQFFQTVMASSLAQAEDIKNGVNQEPEEVE